MKTGYLAPEGFEEELAAELPKSAERFDRLFLVDDAPQKAAWAQNIWHDLEVITFASISDAAKQLRIRGSLWAFYPFQYVRKGTLIEKKLPYFSAKPLSFPCSLPKAPLGSWMILNENTLLASSQCSSPFPHGAPNFVQTAIPPSRAYLKLWELFTLIGTMPQAGDQCLEIGASPGSWTWVLDQLGANILAVDRAPLAPEISSLERVSFLQKDAFTLEPDSSVQWLFSDAACYPEKLLRWLEKWLARDTKAHLVCTLKFQGKGNEAILKEFEKIETSRILHLSHNKHELTWYRPGKF